MGVTSIQWTDRSINPIRARDIDSGAVGHYCEKIAPGCANCYSSNFQKRFHMRPFPGVGRKPDNTELFLDESKLNEVRRRKIPTKWFWCDMTDLFGEWVKPEWIAACLRTMDDTPWHTHQILTKRINRVRGVWTPPNKPRKTGEGISICRENVWLGTSISDQRTADKSVPELLKCRDLSPVLFLSAEPLLGPSNLRRFFAHSIHCIKCHPGGDECKCARPDWVIVGGESGPNARPCNIQWIRDIVRQCADAGVACFVKQLGAIAVYEWESANLGVVDLRTAQLDDKKGGDPDEWPEDLRVREFPKY